MAQQAGVSLRTLAGAEAGQRGLSLATLERVLSAAGLDIALVPRLVTDDIQPLVRHLHLSLTQRLRLGLGLSADLRVRPSGGIWAELVALTRLGTVVLEPPLAHSVWLPTGAVSRVAVVLHASDPVAATSFPVRRSEEKPRGWLVPVTMQEGRRVWVAPPAVLAMADDLAAQLRQVDTLLHTRAPLDDAERRRPAHRDPEEWREDWRLMVTKAIRPEQRPDVRDGRAWRLGSAASLAQRLRER
jgi:hypothetical protein